MKKFMFLCLALAMTLAVAGCSEENAMTMTMQPGSMR